MRHDQQKPARPLVELLKAKSRGRRTALRAVAPRHVGRNDLRPVLEPVERAPHELIFPTRNVRTVDPTHIGEVANAIAEFGFNDPVLIDESNEVLNGVVRVEAARVLGMDSIPCVIARHLSRPQRRQLRLALNRLQEKGSWNLGELKLVMQELIVEDVSLEITGFTRGEVDQILQDDEPSVAEVGPLEPNGGAAPVAKLGEVFQLDLHRIVCGDARDPSVLAAVMSSDKAQLLLTDQPYNCRISGHVTKSHHREFAMASGEMSDTEFSAFNIAWIRAALPCVVEGGVCGTFIDWRGYPTVSASMADVDWSRGDPELDGADVRRVDRVAHPGGRVRIVKSVARGQAAGDPSERTAAPVRHRHPQKLALTERTGMSRPKAKRSHRRGKLEELQMSSKPKKPKIPKRSPKSAAPRPPEADRVGYGMPPRRSQFQPGQSGNPRGRPKGVRNLGTNVRAVLGRRVTVVEHGQRKSVSAAEAILHRYLESAIKGDVKAGAFLLTLLDRFQPTESEDTGADVMSDQDQEIVANLFKQIGKKPKE